MVKFQPCGMEAQPFGGLPVERVADDGAAETGGMDTVDTQLMGAAGERVKLHKSATETVGGQQAAFRHGRTAVDAVDDLTRTVQRVGTEGKVDCELMTRGNGRNRSGGCGRSRRE